MGYYEERKAREAGEEAQQRGHRSYSNPHDQFATDYDTERCHQEWQEGYRIAERHEEDRREEKEAEERRQAHLAEDRKEAAMEEYWRREEEAHDLEQEEQEEADAAE